jgi:transcriptional regulator with XRE-family HTH domain
MSVFTDRLRTRITSLGLSNAEVARRAGLDPRRFGHYATGHREPDFKTLLTICRVLTTDPNTMLGVVGEERAPNEHSAMIARIATACEVLSDDTLRVIEAQVAAVIELQRREQRPVPRRKSRR